MPRAYKFSLIAALAVASACSDNATAPTPGAGGPKASAAVVTSGPVELQVTTTVYDADDTGALVTQSDDYNGAGFATYSPIPGLRNSLTSHVAGDGSWQLFIGNQTVRTLRLMLADAGLPFANGLYSSSVEMGSRCFDASGNQLNIQLLAPGAAFDNCSLIVDFDIGTKKKTTYKLGMGPLFANTGRALVTCTAASGGYCTSWTIVPNDAAPNARVAILTAGNGTTSLDGKLYINSYRVTATK